jgi:hypothetical protein
MKAVTLGLALASSAGAQNLLVNGGFEGSLAGWDSQDASYSTEDAGSSSVSGSARLEATAPYGIARLSQCVNLPPGSELLGAGFNYHVTYGQAPAATKLFFRFHPEPDCNDTPVDRERVAGLDVYDAWSAIYRTIPVPAGTQSVDFSLLMFVTPFNHGSVAANFDDLVLEPVSSLVLGNGRFLVAADWETSQGDKGQGHAVGLTADSGYFWFFDDDNVELVVKVLDGCAVNQRRWVFAGGLTNVRVTLTVHDTLGFYEKTYVNPQNVPFPPLQDVEALPTCDFQ